MEPQAKTASDDVDRNDRSDPTRRFRAVIAAASKGNSSQSELETAALDMVTRLRRENQLPEQVLVQIKQILADAGLRATYTIPGEAPPKPGSEAAIYRDVIAWSIRCYYDGGKPTD